jgi:hypothetical protein
MAKRTIEEVMESLTYSLAEIKDINNPLAVAVVKDEVIAFNEYITKDKGGAGGFENQHMSVFVATSQPLPERFSSAVLKSEATDTHYEVNVREIVAVNWAEGGVVVHFLGTKEVLPKEEENFEMLEADVEAPIAHTPEEYEANMAELEESKASEMGESDMEPASEEVE